MFGFVGYCIQANGLYFPFPLTLDGVTYAQISAAGSPPEQWDALPTLSKLQILGAISVLEMFGEVSYCPASPIANHSPLPPSPGRLPALSPLPLRAPLAHRRAT